MKNKRSGVKQLKNRVIKTFNKGYEESFLNELNAYKTIPFATPKLLDHFGSTLIIERCVPFLSIENPLKYKQPLWELLQEIHEKGIWHTDIALRNVVVHPKRGVLLIDFENAIPATSDISYDLYGAVEAGYKGTFETRPEIAPTGIFWGFDWIECPGKYFDSITKK